MRYRLSYFEMFKTVLRLCPKIWDDSAILSFIKKREWAGNTTYTFNRIKKFVDELLRSPVVALIYLDDIIGYGLVSLIDMPCNFVIPISGYLSNSPKRQVHAFSSHVYVGSNKEYRKMRGLLATVDGPLYFVNHCCIHSASVTFQKGNPTLRARILIPVGNAITINYGKAFFKNRIPALICVCGFCDGTPRF
jgi:hypothetical protein